MYNKEGFFVVSSWDKFKGSFFSGYCFYKDNFIYQQEGYDQYLENTNKHPCLLSLGDGRFSIVRENEGVIEARTDDFGQDILYYYYNEKDWAISNSFRDLFIFLHHKKIVLTPDIELMKLGKIQHSLFQSLFTNETYFKEIKILPVDRSLIISKNGVNCSIELLKCNDINETKTELTNSEVADTLKNYRDSNLRKIKVIQKYFTNITCDISGGNDSRIILSLLLGSGTNIGNIRFASNRNWEIDFNISKKIAKRFNLKINNVGYYTRSIDTLLSYDLWKRGNLGVYFPMYLPKHKQPTPVIHMHGAGGGCIRNAYGFDFKELCDFLQKQDIVDTELLAIIKKKLIQEFNRLNLDVNDPQALMFHYRNFRSRFHFGRSTFRNLHDFLFTPLYSLDLCRLSDYYSDKPFNQIYFDLLSIIKPELRDIEFDTDAKKFTSENYALGRLIFDDIPKVYKIDDMAFFGNTSLKNLEKSYLDASLLSWLMEKDLAKHQELIISSGIYSHKEVELILKWIRKGEITNSKSAISFSHMISIGECLTLCQFDKSSIKDFGNQSINLYEGNKSCSEDALLDLIDKSPIQAFTVKLEKDIDISGIFFSKYKEYKSLLVCVSRNVFKNMTFSKSLGMYYRYINVDPDDSKFDFRLEIDVDKLKFYAQDLEEIIYFSRWEKTEKCKLIARIVQ